ncbi:MAG: hypothetical protein ACUVWX_12505 [Kiritimatiellia bacterium]
MAHMDADAIRRAAERKVGISLSPRVWTDPALQQALAAASKDEKISPGEGVEYLAGILEYVRAGVRGSQGAHPKQPRQRRQSASETMVHAIRQLHAAAAASDPSVAAWRARWLPDGLIPAEEEALRQFLSRREPIEEWVLRGPRDNPTLIEYRSVTEPHDSLDRLAESLAKRYGWEKQAAIFWVLTGILPEHTVLNASFNIYAGGRGLDPPYAYLRLSVPLLLSPREVADHLRRIRKSFGRRTRAVSRSTATLLKHVAQHGDSEASWRLFRKSHRGFRAYWIFRQALNRAWRVLVQASTLPLAIRSRRAR